MQTPAAALRLTLDQLRATIAQFIQRERAHAAMLWHLSLYIYRTLARFESLYERFRAGTLPRPRPPRPAATQATSAPARPRVRLPSRRAWLVRIVGSNAAGAGSQLRHLLARPDLAEFLAAAPQAGRLLRPLCHLLGVTPTPPLALPPRPPRIRPSRPQRPPREPADRTPSPARLRQIIGRPRLPPILFPTRKIRPD